MEMLQQAHGVYLAIPLIVLFLIQLVWSFFLWKVEAPTVGFQWVYRALWTISVATGILGVLFAMAGFKIPVAKIDPSRQWEHGMYGAFVILTLVAEYFILGGVLPFKKGVRWVWLAALFGAAVAFRAIQVAYIPGATLGT